MAEVALFKNIEPIFKFKLIGSQQANLSQVDNNLF